LFDLSILAVRDAQHPYRRSFFMPRLLASILFAPILLALAATAAPIFAAPRVVVDIPPTHSIVARIMEGAGEPTLILPPGASPHGYALRPSEARRVQGADLVIWTGPALTPWLADPLETLAGDAEILTLMDVDCLTVLPFGAQPGGADEHGHAAEGHDQEAHGDGSHDHEAHDHEAHDHEAQGDEGHADGGHEHGHDGPDPHVWLDPANAVVIANAAATALAEADPENAALYQANAVAFAEEMNAQTAGIAALLAGVGPANYLVFHDAYQYFEARFGLAPAGAVSASDAADPGARRVAALRETVRDRDVGCIFAEPQFPPALLETVAEGTGARAATLDPLGAALQPGPDLYPALLAGMAESLATCLSGE
jgi:zinc transport system substrate-binding protein